MDDISEEFRLKTALEKILRMLNYAGLWPSDDFYKPNLYLIYALFVNILFIFLHCLFQVLSIFTLVETIAEFAEFFYFGINEMLIFVKVLMFIKNLPNLKHLVRALDADNFQPRTRIQIEKVRKIQNIWRSFYRFFVFCAALTIALWGLTPIIDGGIKFREFPLLAWYPYNYKKSPWYEITYIFQIVATSFMALSVIDVNMLLISLMMTVACECEILSDNLTNLYEFTELEIKKKNGNMENREYFDYLITQNVVKCIKHHKDILSFAKKSNDVCGSLILAQFSTSIFMISMALFRLTVVAPFSNGFFSLVFYQGYALSEVLAYCYFGNEVTLKSDYIPMAAFLSNWVDFPRVPKYYLLTLMTRTNRCIFMTSFGFFNLTLETFKKIISTAWSYFVVLRQLQIKSDNE